MHRPVSCPRSSLQSLHRGCFYSIHIRRLSSVGTVPVVHNNRGAVATLEPWQDSDGKALAKKAKDAKDIDIEDLSATLEAHRASNRAIAIRKILDPKDSFRQLSLGGDDHEGSGSDEMSEAKEKKLLRMWPADSVQAKEIKGKIGNRGSRDTRNFIKKSDMGDILEYDGHPQQLHKPWKVSKHEEDVELQRPWLAYIETTSEDNLERLTNEIKAYEAYMRLSPREEAASELVISDVKSVAHDKPNIKPLTMLGSRTTGLATPISDFDFTFELPISLPGDWLIPPGKGSVPQPQPSITELRVQAVRALRKMERCLEASKKFGNIQILRHARVPIVRSKHLATGLDVQIQTMASNQAAHEYTIAYLSEFPSLRPLYVVLRHCLELRGLATVFEGGLGSYAIFMMIVTALKHSSGKFTPEDLGGQLLHVLEFYSTADLYKNGFSANPPRVFEKQKQANHQMQTLHPRKPYLLCLQDPANDMNDLGKNSYAIKHIQATFGRAKEMISMAWGKRSDGRPRFKERSCLDGLVRADYKAFELQRSRIEHFASPEKLDAEDFSRARIQREFRKRVDRYRGIPAEDDDDNNHPPESEGEASDGRNATDSTNVKDRLSMKRRIPDDTLAWCYDRLVQSRRSSEKGNANRGIRNVMTK